MKRPLFVFIGLIIFTALGAWWYSVRTPIVRIARTPVGIFLTKVSYTCDAGKTITASYYQGSSTPATSPDMPPTPGGSVALTLSDGRTMTLPQTISASGIRYANANESFIFWSKGEGAFITEHDQQTYANCVEQNAASSSAAH